MPDWVRPWYLHGARPNGAHAWWPFATWDEFERTLPPEQQGSAFACVNPSGVGPRLFFQRVPESKVVKNRVHVDLRCAALDAETARLVELGASVANPLGEHEWVTLADPEGNEFCLFPPL